MKKIFLIHICLLVGVFNLMAQDEESTAENTFEGRTQRFKAGILVGMNASQVDGDDMAGFNKFGINAGVRGTILLSRRFEVAVDILYAQKGSNGRTNNGSQNVYNFHYAEIPILLVLKDWKMMANAGIAVARLLDLKLKVNGVDETDRVLTDYKNMDYSVVLGLGFFPTKHIGINLNWQRSLLSIKQSGLRGEVNRLLTLRGIYMF